MAHEAISLRPHQIEALEAVVAGLDIPPGKRIPAEGLRGTVVSACGTGKTFIGAAAAKRLVPHGRVLVLVPTLELLAQTVVEWRGFGHAGPMVAVCSLNDDPRLHAMGVRCTTSAPQLSLWHGSGPVTVFATYASLGVVTEAHTGEYGLPMDLWDLVLVDEAHRTSGSLGKAWAAVHEQELLPAMRRLYMTATPRVWEERPAPRLLRSLRESGGEGVPAALDPLPEEMACSMDDEAIYGPVLYELDLSEAIARGLLARYQIVVAEVRDDSLTPERLYGESRHEESVRGERLAVLQAALLETMASHDLTRCITFHHRTMEARAFSEGLGRVVKRLHAEDPERYPAEVWTSWLSGEHDPDLRAERLTRFGSRVGRAVMSNCRVLSEGVDVPSVDSVALIDPKGSAVDIVQAIGRALRQKPGQGKLATLVVPVILGRDEGPEDMPYSLAYRPLVKVLNGLRAHDERAVEMLAIPQESTARTKAGSSYLGAEPVEGEVEQRALLRFGSHRDPALVARFVRYNLLEPEHANWKAGHRAAVAFRKRTGHLNVPYEHRELTPNQHSFPLGRWLADQRRALQAGTLAAQRAADLEELGIDWTPADTGWEENLAAARAYYATAGTLAAPVTATALDKPVGQWLANCRKGIALGKDPQRAERRAAQLAEIDPDWRPAWPVDWQRTYAAVGQMIAMGTVLEDIVPGVTASGTDVGRWLQRQRQHVVWVGLAAGQRERLTGLGVTPPLPVIVEAGTAPIVGSKTGGKGPKGMSAAFLRGCKALEQYRARTGTVEAVSRAHTETLEDGTEVRLGVWLSNTKTRRATLSREQVERLAGLGLEWARIQAQEGAA
ncbi:Helicase associated domain protein [Streptomyces sp. NBC_01171]|uniref:DEAD/DEAH box helicase n=1 Tax=Streptomyces sp. NBC_01171 TaxID=2903757 RepID=UPI0038642E37|nr:Helicase associated domain protein [Streptomyces sp. NBC_01171]WST06133.1 Helicase associated domain protein [Streptomyces sp. NBC_01171]